MNLDDFILACFCLSDDQLPEVLKGKPLHTRGLLKSISVPACFLSSLSAFSQI
jgi:hypothetical protein